VQWQHAKNKQSDLTPISLMGAFEKTSDDFQSNLTLSEATRSNSSQEECGSTPQPPVKYGCYCVVGT
jgi:hypothetical protein